MPKRLTGLRFGTAGIPNSTPKKTTVNGIKRVWELGLDAMEIEFVRGIKMNVDMAHEIKNVATELGIALTVHAPYYINLNSVDNQKVEASIRRIVESAYIGFEAGAWSVVFHTGYYGGFDPTTVYNNVRDVIKKIVNELRDRGIDIWIRPEVMGGLSEIGSLEEVISLSQDIGENVLPCIDFAHLHARSLGRYNSYSEFREVMEVIEKKLGREALSNMHMHISGINYGPKGEVKHLNLAESDLNYRDLVKILKEFNVEGVIISESPNLEEDALLLKKYYQTIQ
ncbi:MAG: TIM barrel protein [Ignisphaera sp.]|uniref:Xylose isomerase-like TIM barrel domain-containing protein n=1 Tax=Ignisphaera aggregans TaxID=334771 RepID=A0A7J3I6M9_9CREN